MRVAEFLRQFHDPDPRFSPAPIWWWSGEKLRIDRLRWQMDQLKSMGIHNLVILNLAPSGALFGCEADDPAFLSEEWWSIFGQVCDHAKQIGSFIWFYDQIGFSGANYQADLVAKHPEFSAEKLRLVSVEGGGDLRVECPGAGTPIAAYAVKSGIVEYVPIANRAASFSGEAKLNLVYSLRQGYDYFSPEACDKLLDTVHREFERRLPQHIGTTIVGSFQDELPDLPTWGRTFADTFAEQFGYRVEQVIHRLFEEGEADSRRTRLHYHQHRANLAEAALFKPFFRWHEKRGLICGFDQQSPAREARAIGCVQKYADYIQTHRWYGAPGSDLHGNGKLHSSIAWMYDRPRVWIEGFHSTGWGGTIADTFDWLMPYLQSGCNLYNPHAVYYSTRMGWWEWAPPSTCWRQPYAMHYRGFADMISRLTKLLAQGVHEATVGVLFPTATVQSALGPQNHFPDAESADQALHRIIGSMRWHEFQLGILDELAIDFHLLDEATLVPQKKGVRFTYFSDSADKSGTVCIGESEEISEPDPLLFGRLKAVILPHVRVLADRTVAAIEKLGKSGVRIIAVGSAIIETPDGNTLDVRTLPNALFVESVEALPGALATVKPAVRCPVPFLYRRTEDLHLLFIPAAKGMATVVEWPDWERGLDRATIDPTRYLKCAEIGLPAEIKQVWRFDPIDCSAVELELTGGKIDLDFGGAPFAVLVGSESEISNSKSEIELTSHSLKLSDDWTCQYVPTLPTDFPDVYDPRRPELRGPHSAEFTWTRQNHAPEIVRATFGVQGWCGSRAIVYSPQFGIATDRIHMPTLGPKGHVPEEFIDSGELKPGERCTIRTGVISECARGAVLAIGANAAKEARPGDVRAMQSGEDYLWMTPVNLAAGENPIEITLTASRKERVRAFWCLLEPGREHLFARPERLIPRDDPIPGSRLVYRGTFVSGRINDGQIQVSVAAVATVWIDSHRLGQQGGFDPYRLFTRGLQYTLPVLDSGEHEIRVELIDPGTAAPVLVDLRARDARGAIVAAISDAKWTVSRDDGPVRPVRICARQEGDGAIWHLYRRPHPLPGAAWIEGPQERCVLDLPTMPASEVPVEQRFEWIIPPGATQMRLELADGVEGELSIDGISVLALPSGEGRGEGASALQGASGNLNPLTLTLSRGERGQDPAARHAELRVRSRHLGGAVFATPVFYQFASGTLACGSWLNQGLRSYSGAIRMSQQFRWDQPIPDVATLDLGPVRGTVEALLNGKSIGVRFMLPYRFDLKKHLQSGENHLELLVTNTLANFLATWSPTRNWATDQLDCGLSGLAHIEFCVCAKS